MTNIIMIAALAGTVAVASSVDAIEHRVQVDHHKGAIDARYRSTVDIAHRQVGAVGPAGRPSSLRCMWRERHDRSRSAVGNGYDDRAITREGAISGSRPGWCATQRKAIATKVAARGDEVRAHMLAAEDADRADLLAEIDRIHGGTRDS